MIYYFGRNGLLLLTKNALPEKVPKSLARPPPPSPHTNPRRAKPERMHFFFAGERPLFKSTLSAVQYLGLALLLREWYLGVQ